MDEVDELRAKVAELEDKLRTSSAAQQRMASAIERSDIRARDKENELVRIRAAERKLTHLYDGETVTKSLCGEDINPLFADLDLTADVERAGCFKCLQALAMAQQDGMRLLADERDKLDAKVRHLREEMVQIPLPQHAPVPGLVQATTGDEQPEKPKGFISKLLGR